MLDRGVKLGEFALDPCEHASQRTDVRGRRLQIDERSPRCAGLGFKRMHRLDHGPVACWPTFGHVDTAANDGCQVPSKTVVAGPVMNTLDSPPAHSRTNVPPGS